MKRWFRDFYWKAKPLASAYLEWRSSKNPETANTLRWRFREFKWWVGTQVALWRLAREAKPRHEDPKGGVEEVSRLRKRLVVERRWNEPVAHRDKP